MKKIYSRSALCGMRIMYSALEFLVASGGSARTSAVRAHLEESCSFSDWEAELVNGVPRWQTFLSFYSSQYSVAGFIRKLRGSWYITDEGGSVLSTGLSSDELFETATSLYRSSHAGMSAVPSTSEPSAELVSSDFSVEDIQSKADDGFASYLASLNPYEFQDLVAALLRAMGYFTPFVAPKGRDGGVDVLAFRDALGASGPRLKVQVKHYPSSAVGVETIRQLVGLLTKDGDAGVVVTSGSFTSEALREARSSHRHVRLIDGSELVSLWLEYYPRMSDSDKVLMPVTTVYFVLQK